MNAVAALYEGHADALALHASYAFGPDPHDECGPRLVASGRDASFAALRKDLEGGRVDIVACAADGRTCLIEGAIDGVATIGASLRLDENGAIERVLSFRTSPVERREAVDGGDARARLDAYFDRLERADFDAAVECFSTDVLYSHPPYAPGGPRVEHHGREALLAGFVARGPRDWHHRVITCAQREGECLVEGDVEGAGVWMSSFSLDRNGLISRYCAFYAR